MNSESTATNPVWTRFLQEQGAQFDASGERIVTFGHAEVERYLIKHGPVITNLSHHALLKVTGTDAFDFLQGQLSSDLTDVNENRAQLSSYCDPQGNVLAVFTVFKIGDAFYLSFHGSLKTSIEKRLKMFVLRSDVQISDVSQEMIHIGFAGEFADLDVQRRLSTKIKETYETGMLLAEGMQNICIVKVPGPYHKYDLFGPVEEIQQAWIKLREGCDFTNTQDWNLLNIAAAVPEVTAETSGKYTAQFLNLDKLDAINFRKGCFPGQEIIARIHYRGKVTKRMLRVRLDEIMELNAGDTLTLKDGTDKSFKLEVILANPDVLSGTRCLAVGTLKSLESAQGELKTESGQAAVIEPMPYSITDEE